MWGGPLAQSLGSKPIISKLNSEGCIEVNQVRLERRECPRKRNSVSKGLGKTTNTGVWGTGLVPNGWTVERSEDAGEKGDWREGSSCRTAEMGACDVFFLRLLRGVTWSDDKWEE